MAAPLNVSLMITANASGVAAAVGETRSELEAVGTSARDTQGALDRLDVANDGAAVSAKRAGDAARGQAAAERDLAAAVASFAGIRPDTSGSDYARRAADINAYGASLDQLRAKFNPVFAASKAYERELDELSRAQRMGAITVGEHGAALELLNARYASAGQASAQFANQAGMARMQTANLGYQIQDIGTMMASGQNPFMLLAQQLPQVTMHGGQLTGVMGALKGQVAELFSPLGLLTTGFVLAGSAAISYFTSATDEADAAADALDDELDLIRRVADEWGNAVPEIRAYADERERALSKDELNKATQATIDARYAQARAEIGELRTSIGELISDMYRAGESSAEVSAIRDAFNEADQAAQDLRDAQKEGRATAEASERVNRALATLLGNEFVAGADDASAAIRRYRDALSEAADQGGRLANSRAVAELTEKELGVLGRVGPVYSGGGKFLNEAELQEERANATKSQYQIEQERLARRTRAPRKTEAERAGERYDDIIANAEAAIAAQRLEAEAYGMTELAADRLRQQQILLNQARSADIALTPEQIENLKELGTTLADVTAETERQGEVLADRKAMWGDVIGGLREAASDGKIELQELGDIGMRVLDRLIDKIQTDLSDALSSLGGGDSSGGGFGGILSSIFGGLFGGGPAVPTGGQFGLAAFGGAGLYDDGGDTGSGYTGAGGRLQVAGLVHRDEFVFSSPAVRTIGVSRLDRMHQAAKSGRGFDDGGWTGGAPGGWTAGRSGGGAGVMHFTQENNFSGVVTPKEIEAAIEAGTENAVARARSEFRVTYHKNNRAGTLA
tara:strand:- start:3095 stop:5497 length:2403 start_codon:yes stop_codon:yes gene_type:complete